MGRKRKNQNDQNQEQKTKETKQETSDFSYMTYLLSSPGLHHIPICIFSGLDVISLAHCRLLSKQCQELIDNTKILIDIQLNQVKSQPLLIKSEGITRKFTFFKRWPDWKKVFNYIQNQENDVSNRKLFLTFIKDYIVNNRPRFIESPLIDCILQNQDDILELLLKTPLVIDKHFLTESCNFGDVKTVKLLLKYRFPNKKILNTQHEGQTVLHHACMNEKHGVDVVKYLLTYPGINVKAVNEDGMTPMDCAKDYNSPANHKEISKIIKSYKKYLSLIF